MSKKILIGLAGPARSGKSTIGGFLRDLLSVPTYALAGPIKEACNTIFGWDNRHAEGELKEVVDPFWGISPRLAYQTLGTEWGRQLIRDDIWLRRAKMMLDASNGLIITDVRFPNEQDWLAANGGLLIHVRRIAGAGAFNGIAGHASEAGLEPRYNEIVVAPGEGQHALHQTACYLARTVQQ